jgi:radical SAM-linked protein
VFIDYRVFYTKTGRLKYISHLDVNRLMQRTLKRSGLPVWYSEGFNPHIYITFALPLALGLESYYEVMDFRLTAELPEKEIARRIQSSLPDGMDVLSVSKPVAKAQDVASALFRVKLFSERPFEIKKYWDLFLEQQEITVEKKTKKGTKVIDIRPDIVVKQAEETPEAFIIDLLLPAGIPKNISPFLVLEGLESSANLGIDRTEIAKIDVFTKDGKQFR